MPFTQVPCQAAWVCHLLGARQAAAVVKLSTRCYDQQLVHNESAVLLYVPLLVCAGLSNVTVVWSRAEDGGRQQDLRDVSGRCSSAWPWT
jgi:hypothetical protein